MSIKNSAKSSNVQHGGICSSCGQISNTCVTGSKHQVCPGKLVNSKVRADLGTEEKQGTWLTLGELNRLQDEAVLDGQEALAKKVILTSVFDASGKYVKTIAQNGFGDVVHFHAGGGEGNKGVWLP